QQSGGETVDEARLQAQVAHGRRGAQRDGLRAVGVGRGANVQVQGEERARVRLDALEERELQAAADHGGTSCRKGRGGSGAADRGTLPPTSRAVAPRLTESAARSGDGSASAPARRRGRLA